MAILPKVKLKALLTFPATVNGGTGIDVTRANGGVSVDLDYSEFGQVSTVPANPNLYTLIYDTSLGNYTLAPVSLFGVGGGGGIADAPLDGFQYGRQSATWTKSVPEAPNNANQYGRQGTAWTVIPANVASIGGATGAVTVSNGISQAASNVKLNYVTVLDGLDNTGATDVGATLNARIQASPAYSILLLPVGIYLTSVTIVVDNGRTLRGMTGGFAASQPEMGSCIRGTLALTPVVQLDGGVASQAVNLSYIQISRAAGTVPANCRGLEIWRVNNGNVEHCLISRHYYGIYSRDLNVAVMFYHNITTAISHSHVVLDAQSIEMNFHHCRMGMNGSIDVASTAYFLLNSNGWDTIRIDHCQLNQGSAHTQHGILIQGYNTGGNVNGIILIDSLHAETFDADFIAVSSSNRRIPRLSISNSQINGGAVFFGGTPAAMFNEMNISNTRIDAPFTLDQQLNVMISGSNFYQACVINAVAYTAITGNLFDSNVTLQGTCVKAAFVGNSVVGTLSNTATGFTVANNA